jgi:NADH dehydrogenase
MNARTPLPKVVIVGCGFGGLEAVRALSRAAVEITLVDRTNHHLFQPLLYQVATAGLSAPAVSAPIRHALRHEMRRGNLTILQAEVTAIDPVARLVVLDRPDEPGAVDTLPYDHLIVASGSTHSYFGHADWEAHAPGLKTLADAFAIRAKVIGAFEHAERCTDAATREPWLTFVVIGGGPTGVEMAGTMTEIARHTLRGEFRRIDPSRSRVVLIEGSDRILGTFVQKLSQRAAEQLQRLGVDVRTGCKVTGIDADGVTYEARSGEAVTRHRLDARTVIWAAGVAATPLGRTLAAATGASVDRAGRVVIEPDLSLPGHPVIAVIGDLAAARSHGKGAPTPVPGVSPAAKQMGRTAAANLLRRLRGAPTREFRYIDYGNLATVGRKAAVVDLSVPGVGALRFSGFPAWLFWLFAHIYFLIGFRNRLTVMVDWAWAYVTYERSARVVAEPPAAVAHPGS